MPTKRIYLLEQILQVKAADLFYRRTLSEQYFLQGSMLTKVKLKFLIRVSNFWYSLIE